MPTDSRKINRRDFLKLCAATPLVLSLPRESGGLLGPKYFSKTIGEKKLSLYKVGKRTPSICGYCAGGCGVIITTINGKVVETEGDPYHPINMGSTCSKLAAYIQLVNNERRLTKPLMRTNPKKGINEDPGWIPISWDMALEIVAEKIVEAAQTHKYEHEEVLKGKTIKSYYRLGKDSPVL